MNRAILVIYGLALFICGALNAKLTDRDPTHPATWWNLVFWIGLATFAAAFSWEDKR